jgi:hypothetical protein
MRRLLRNDLLRGAAIGVAVALIVVAAITRIAESDTSIWWWPATAVAGVFGGAVIGALIGGEAEGEPPDEAYGSAPQP